MKTDSVPIVKSEMLIRRPARDIFEALVNPDITTKFWFTKSSGPLEEGKTVIWTWEQFGVSGEILVTEMKQDRLIKFEWPAEEEGSVRTVQISIEPKSDEKTFV